MSTVSRGVASGTFLPGYHVQLSFQDLLHHRLRLGYFSAVGGHRVGKRERLSDRGRGVAHTAVRRGGTHHGPEDITPITEFNQKAEPLFWTGSMNGLKAHRAQVSYIVMWIFVISLAEETFQGLTDYASASG